MTRCHCGRTWATLVSASSVSLASLFVRVLEAPQRLDPVLCLLPSRHAQHPCRRIDSPRNARAASVVLPTERRIGARTSVQRIERDVRGLLGGMCSSRG